VVNLVARRFQFRLQTLLRVRELEEREAQRKVAAKAAEIAQLDRLDAQAQQEIRRQQAVLRAAQHAATLDSLLQQRGRAWIGQLRRGIALRSAQRAARQAELRELQDAFRAARTRRRVVDELRTRRWQDYRHARDRHEQTSLEELARGVQEPH
jgi:flagellar biosynthesis chaperone FliJ